MIKQEKLEQKREEMGYRNSSLSCFWNAEVRMSLLTDENTIPTIALKVN